MYCHVDGWFPSYHPQHLSQLQSITLFYSSVLSCGDNELNVVHHRICIVDTFGIQKEGDLRGLLPLLSFTHYVFTRKFSYKELRANDAKLSLHFCFLSFSGVVLMNTYGY